jgi:Mn2+/Fe2+ NRAMP family transporter
VFTHLLVPHISLRTDYLTVVVAVFGTTISPHLFFWRAGEDVEDINERENSASLLDEPAAAPREIERIRIDTYVGMGLSNLVALFIDWISAATLHAHGITNVQTSAEAAEALRPLTGGFAFTIFAIGIISAGLPTVPILAGSVA